MLHDTANVNAMLANVYSVAQVEFWPRAMTRHLCSNVALDHSLKML